MKVARLLSGGQTGADRAGLDAARTLGIPYAGWCPAGGWAEDLTEPPGLLAAYPGLRATPDPDPATRTRWNVRDSTAVLVLHLGGAARSPGTGLTLRTAEELDRHRLCAAADDEQQVRAWLASLPRPVVLDVAGPRESEEPGLHAAAYRTLVAVLGPDPAPNG
jgi:hypothetical protein